MICASDHSRSDRRRLKSFRNSAVIFLDYGCAVSGSALYEIHSNEMKSLTQEIDGIDSVKIDRRS
ncbi:hypothetical protein P175DRAFT_0503296 [Aspergillus ochraceoroseus IBT 24754]|uniref:Uncharacterized protein n=1 Tax=Aspergillus ochraceoroseus IBT 24754 TaxID=1392256 RepID=A0A2T5LQF4_9EURO|nr:uncharacterized protein P175DRAFT_0503296 [Aspergillus ochraceoroseus IBT 24754]PTU18496.1 hypothetical protein P175DRAFT_0503296 [Aspergillus ochraceoroseus IBT 24754]